MRRTWTILIALLAVVLMATPAAAKKGGGKGPPDGDQGMAGVTCAILGYPPPEEPEGYEGSGPFTLTVIKGEVACVDVVAPAGDWTVDVTEAVSVSRAIIRVQDSVEPGDICGDWPPSSSSTPGGIDGPLTTGPYWLYGIPDATVNACGTEYGELIAGQAVYAADPEAEHPLAFVAFGPLKGKKGAYYTITVTPPS